MSRSEAVKVPRGWLSGVWRTACVPQDGQELKSWRYKDMHTHASTLSLANPCTSMPYHGRIVYVLTHLPLIELLKVYTVQGHSEASLVLTLL